MNEVPRPIIGKFFVLYFDDILVYNRDEQEHASHLHKVLSVLAQEKLYGNLKKYHFLGYVVFAQGTHVDDDKVKTEPLPRPDYMRRKGS